MYLLQRGRASGEIAGIRYHCAQCDAAPVTRGAARPTMRALMSPRAGMKRLALTCILLAPVLFGEPVPLSTPQAVPLLAFRIDEGQNINSFVRQGPVAAHLLLRAGQDPRILVAFPAGNSGVGLWFERTTQPVSWTLTQPPRPISISDDRRRPLHGIEFEVSVDARELRPHAAVLSSIRVLRDYELQRTAPPEIRAAPGIGSGQVFWARDRLDGAAGYRLVIEAREGAHLTGDKFSTDTAPLRLRVQAFSGEPPLQPIAAPLAARAAEDPRSSNVLAFLAYREKLLAGSWRFDTYFGRDTLISALLLAPVLAPETMESAITSVLERLAPNGEVAHEEDIGEFAVLRNAREGRGRIDTPVYDYGMVDDDFMLAPLAARWLLDDPRGRDRARAFLLGKSAGGERRGDALVRNLTWVVQRTASFAAQPRADNLISIKSGRMTGDWRDSEQGLGRGRFAYDINAALVPAALDATARLAQSGVLADFLDAEKRRSLQRARAQADVWTARAPGMFAVDVPASRARAAITDYAKEAGVDDGPAIRALGESPLAFHALSLDQAGRPVPILNSDEGFRLLLTQPPAAELERCITAIMRPFPAGLITGAGMLVANPLLATPDLRREFTRFAYHGTVVWSWQQALMAAALERQLRRSDLPPALLTRLGQARAVLWTAIEASRALRTSELWSWSYGGGRYHIEAFGRPGADVDESNAAQLWSTVYLGLSQPPYVAVTTGTSPGN